MSGADPKRTLLYRGIKLIGFGRGGKRRSVEVADVPFFNIASALLQNLHVRWPDRS